MRTHGQEPEGLSDLAFLLYQAELELLELYQSLHYITIHYIISHAYTHTYALCSNFDKVQVINLTPLE